MTELKKKMTELKKCPFCGRRPTLVASPKEDHVVYVVVCTKCCNTIPKPTEQEAKDTWNRRVDNERP